MANDVNECYCSVTMAVKKVFYLSCEMAGVYFAKENDLRDWGITENKKNRPK